MVARNPPRARQAVLFCLERTGWRSSTVGKSRRADRIPGATEKRGPLNVRYIAPRRVVGKANRLEPDLIQIQRRRCSPIVVIPVHVQHLQVGSCTLPTEQRFFVEQVLIVAKDCIDVCPALHCLAYIPSAISARLSESNVTSEAHISIVEQASEGAREHLNQTIM